MLSRTAWARAATLTAAFAVATAALPAEIVFAQDSPSVALEQARAGEDGSSGAGADSGNATTGNAKRDKNGNGGSASAGSAGDTGEATAGEPEGNNAPLPENAELLDALGILDDVTIYGIDVLTGMNIPVELLPAPNPAPVPAAPTDVNTGGHGSSSTISTEPGDGTAPAGGATNSAAEDGVGSTTNGEKVRDRPRKNADGGTDTATTGGETTTTGS